MKFNIGDIVIGNDYADIAYGITKKGWIGEVQNIYDNKIIMVQDIRNISRMYIVDEACFDLYQEKITKYDNMEFISLAGL